MTRRTTSNMERKTCFHGMFSCLPIIVSMYMSLQSFVVAKENYARVYRKADAVFLRFTLNSRLTTQVLEVHPEYLSPSPNLVALLPQPLILGGEHLLLLLQLVLHIRQLPIHTEEKVGRGAGASGWRMSASSSATFFFSMPKNNCSQILVANRGRSRHM